MAAVQPTTPESRNRHGHRAPYGPAIPRPVRHCSHVGLDVTHDRCQYGPWAAGPFARETSEDGLASSSRPEMWPATSLPRSMRPTKEIRRGKATVRARKAATL